MKRRRWLPGVLAAAAVLVAGALWLVGGARQDAALGDLDVTPTARRLSIRVGETVNFAAAAPGAVQYTWWVWGRAVSNDPIWSWVPSPEDAGWQQVTVVSAGAGGRSRSHTWDVGVVPTLPPEVGEVTPPAGSVQIVSGEPTRFRCAARIAAARPSDRLRFQWTLDEQSVLSEERPAASGLSELVVDEVDPGTHHLVVRVTEDDRVASLVEWKLETMPQAARPTITPRLVRTPASRLVEGVVGAPLTFGVVVEPAEARVSCRWSVDGKPVRGAAAPRFEYVAATPGRHRVAVTAMAEERPLGSEVWLVTVQPPATERPTESDAEQPPDVGASPAPTEPSPPPPSASVTSPVAPTATVPGPPPPTGATLAEAEVRSWLEEYARAWARKDIAALWSMGHIRSAAEAVRLERYFNSINELHVDLHVIEVRLDGARALVEFERIDTVTDPAGRRQELRLPPLRKEIERTPQGLRFAARSKE